MVNKLNILYKNIYKSILNKFIISGLSQENAHLTAEALCTASLRGTDSHGIRLLPHYLKAIQEGRINAKATFTFSQTSLATGILDANHGMGHAAVAIAMDHAIELANNSGVGLVSVKNSNHCGAMAYYAMRACEKDMIGFASTNATPKLQTFNSSESFFGINPICLAAPMEGEEPFCYDAAPSIMSNNRIKMYAERGESLPMDVAADEYGNMTTDPMLAKMLFPIGGNLAGYKGFGLSMIVDILCSLLSDMPSGKDVSAMYPHDGGTLSEKRLLGQFVGAIRIEAFEDVEVFKKRLKENALMIRSSKKLKGVDEDVMVPGDPEKRVKKIREVEGIPVDTELAEILSMK